MLLLVATTQQPNGLNVAIHGGDILMTSLQDNVGYELVGTHNSGFGKRNRKLQRVTSGNVRIT